MKNVIINEAMLGMLEMLGIPPPHNYIANVNVVRQTRKSEVLCESL